MCIIPLMKANFKYIRLIKIITVGQKQSIFKTSFSAYGKHTITTYQPHKCHVVNSIFF